MPHKRIVLDVNVQAPHFETVDIYGKKVNLNDYKGKKLLIGFFRHAGCPFCNLRVYYLQDKYFEYRNLGMEMVFFFESPARILKSTNFFRDVSQVPIISDEKKIWYSKYGVEDSFGKSLISHMASFIQTAIKSKLKKLPMHVMKEGESFNTMPAEFLVDEEGIIRKIMYANRLTDRLAITELNDFVGRE